MAAAVRALVVAAGLAGLGAAAAWSVRLGWADYLARQETVESTEKALRVTPDQEAYWVRLALLTAEDAPARSEEALERAVRLNPADGRAWIELGLRKEMEGKVEEAERCFLRAAEVDREYVPRWTLVNYYFRRGERAKFIEWARAAAEMVHGDAAALFRLCGAMEEDGRLIDRLDMRRPDVRAAYLEYLLGRGRADLAMPAARKVLEGGREEDTAALLDACDRLLEAKRVDDAAEIWNGLSERHRISAGRVDADKGPVVANGGFAAPGGRGFDWRLAELEGVSASGEEAPGGLRLTFSGKQPEECEVLSGFLPLKAGTRYSMKFQYRTEAIAAGAGLRWRVTEVDGGTTLAEGESLSAESETQGGMEFETPRDCRLGRLALRYQRAAGTTRIAGYVVLRMLEVTPRAQGPAAGPPSPRVMK